METTTIANTFSAFFEESKKGTFSSSPDFVIRMREEAMQSFLQKGFPAKKDENYKYTHLEPIFSNGYKKYASPRPIHLDVNHIFKCDVPSLDTYNVILLNGFYYDAQKPLLTLPGNVIVGSFSEAVKQYPDLVSKHLGKYAKTTDSFVALNTALTTDGIFIHIPKNTVLEKPIQVINVLLSDEELMVQHRNLIIVEDNSEAKVVVCDHTLSPQKFLTNSVTEIYVGEQARFNYFKVQNEHNDSAQVSHTYIEQAAASSVQSSAVTLHGGMVRNNLYIRMNGEGCENNANGLFVTDKTQHVDNFVFVEHAKANCNSSQLFKGILDEKSTGAFTGRILVDRDAQKTSAYQKNSSILLTDEAKMNSKPQLEIYADDVKCGHGGTVGQLDEEALFYLRTRGIDEREAKLMLMYGFADEIMSKIQIEPLKVRMNELIDKRLRGELSRCNNCAMNCG